MLLNDLLFLHSMKKSLLAILNRRSKKRKHHDDSEDDVKENQVGFYFDFYFYCAKYY